MTSAIKVITNNVVYYNHTYDISTGLVNNWRGTSLIPLNKYLFIYLFNWGLRTVWYCEYTNKYGCFICKYILQLIIDNHTPTPHAASSCSLRGSSIWHLWSQLYLLIIRTTVFWWALFTYTVHFCSTLCTRCHSVYKFE